MSEAPQVPSKTKTTAPHSVRRRWLRFPGFKAIGLGLIMIIGTVFSLADLLAPQNKESQMFALGDEIIQRYSNCNYHFLFFCDPKPKTAPVPAGCENKTGVARGAYILTDNGEAESTSWWTGLLSNFYVKIAVGAVVTLPRLPDALIHMLKCRWKRGHLEFSLGVLFVYVYLTLMVVALREEGGGNLWYFACAIIAGPYLVAFVFWVLQHWLAGASPAVNWVAGLFTWILGGTLCTRLCFAHDIEMFRSLLKHSHG